MNKRLASLVTLLLLAALLTTKQTDIKAQTVDDIEKKLNE